MPDEGTPREGTMVSGSIRLLRPLGEGGMGSVWIADHLTLKTRVAVKFISHLLAHDTVAVARFSREAAAAAQVKSPHVVQTFDHGLDAHGTPYIVMELLEGEDLGKLLDRRKKLTPAETMHVVSQIAKALARAHEKGIVHRDIKPENVFLCDGGADEIFVKVLDFGVAKTTEAVTATTTTGAMVGTPFYMSPEQIVGAKEIDHRTDLWSLGVMTFEMLTSRRPFRGESLGALAVAIHSTTLPRPCQLDSSLPAAMDAWFEKACARDVDARFGSARELSATLSSALGVAARPPAMTVDGEGRTEIRVSDAGTDPGLALEKTALAGTPPEPPPRGETHVGVASSMGPPSPPARGPTTFVALLVAIAIVGGVVVWRMASESPTRTSSTSSATTAGALSAAAIPSTAATSSDSGTTSAIAPTMSASPSGEAKEATTSSSPGASHPSPTPTITSKTSASTSTQAPPKYDDIE